MYDKITDAQADRLNKDSVTSYKVRLGSILQALWGRFTSPYVMHTPEGGLAIPLINKTGAPSVKGAIVATHPDVDEAFRLCPASAPIPIGAVYESGIPDGGICWVVVSGIAEVLLKNDTGAVRTNWVGISDVAGRAIANAHPGAAPPETAVHNGEVGHSIQNKVAGTNVLAKIVMHFN